MARLRDGIYGHVLKNSLLPPLEGLPRVEILVGAFQGATGYVFSENQIQGGAKGTYLTVRIQSEQKSWSYVVHFSESQVRYL